MKSKIIVFVIICSFINKANAQFQLQSFVGKDGLEFFSLYQKDISANKKLAYYGYSNYSIEFNKTSKGESELYQVINYKLYKNSGLSFGGTLANGEFMPEAGLSLGGTKRNFNFNLFPALNYSFRSKNLGYGINGQLTFNPKINDQWNYYNLLILGSDFGFKEHTSSNQIIRIGAEYKDKIEFGVGVNLSEQGRNFNFDSNFGVFVGINL
jgi:hypothetical protein